jgi:putative intracellular protease/amidase
MNQVKRPHPAPEKLSAFAQGLLPPAEQAEVEKHVADCDACCQALRAVPDGTLLIRLRAGAGAGTAGPGASSLPGAAPPKAPGKPPADDLELPPELANHPRYRIVRRLGAGGMGVVYQAEHRLMERAVALKVISRSLTSNPLAVERFLREVKAAARLPGHPNVVIAHDAEQAGDLHLLVMEHVEGVSLNKLVEQRGPLSVGRACHFVRQAALGLQHAHEHGLVHRDVKPHNLMVTRQGQVKVLDFGLARLCEGAPGTGPRRVRKLTTVGTVIGTPDYIAPEQVGDSHTADIRSDVYSLGCTLYFLLAGQPPFPSGTAVEKALSHVESAPRPLSELRPGLPPALLEVLERMMAKAPDQRYQLPVEVARALEAFVKPAASSEEERPPQPCSRPRRRRSRVMLLLAAAALLLVGLATAVALRGSRGPGPSPAVPSNPPAPPAPRVLMVVPHKQFWYPDYGPVRAVLEEGGVRVKVASSSLERAMPHHTKAPAVQPDLLIGSARAADCDAVVFVGGQFLEYRGDRPADRDSTEQARRLIREMLAADKPVAAICTAPSILAAAGVLEGKPASWNARVTPYMAAGNVKRSTDRVVVSGRIITAGDFIDAPLFARAVLDAVKQKK